MSHASGPLHKIRQARFGGQTIMSDSQALKPKHSIVHTWSSQPPLHCGGHASPSGIGSGWQTPLPVVLFGSLSPLVALFELLSGPPVVPEVVPPRPVVPGPEDISEPVVASETAVVVSGSAVVSEVGPAVLVVAPDAVPDAVPALVVGVGSPVDGVAVSVVPMPVVIAPVVCTSKWKYGLSTEHAVASRRAIAWAAMPR